MSKTDKTNASRMLDRAKVPHKLVEYPVDEEHLDAQHIADTLGEDIRDVYKTIVLHGDRAGYFVCVVPGYAEIDLKKAARVAGDKKVDLIPVKELLPLTGYIRGGCSPLGMKKAFPTYFDATITERRCVFVSAGRRGLQICVEPQPLIAAVGGSVADIIQNQGTETETEQ